MEAQVVRKDIGTEGEFYHNYIKTVKNKSTREGAIRSLKQYARYLQEKGEAVTNLSDLGTFFRCEDCLANNNVCKGDKDELQRKIIEFCTYLEEKKLYKFNSIRHTIWKIYGLYESNDIVLNTKKIINSLAEDIDTNEDRAYRADEIKQIVDNSNLCYKAVILLLASTGIRIGGIFDHTTDKYLRVGDFEKATESFDERELEDFKREVPNYTDDAGKITVYKGNRKWEYYTFCTPEAYKAINEYLEYRRAAGEKINDNSPLFRTEFNPQPVGRRGHSQVYVDTHEKKRIEDIKNPKPLRYSPIQDYISRRCIDLNIGNRRIAQLNESNGSKIMHEIKTLHGFRKFTTTTMHRAGVDDLMNQKLTGHKLKDTRESYYKWEPWQLLAEYWKAVPALTIDKTIEYKIQNKQLDEKVKKVEIQKTVDMGNMYHDYMRQMNEKDNEVKELRTDLKKIMGWAMNKMNEEKGVPIPYSELTEKTQESPEALPAKTVEEDAQAKMIREMKEKLDRLEEENRRLREKQAG